MSLIQTPQDPRKVSEVASMIQGDLASRATYAGEKAEMPQFRRDSLDAARAMAAAGKTPEEIRAVTGWFPGKYDGKMRWEIPDDKAKFIEREFDTPPPKIVRGNFGSGVNDFIPSPDGYYVAEVNGKPDWATAAETRDEAEARYYDFRPRKIRYGFGVSGKLFDVIEHGNLFKAYPSAREIAVEFRSLPPEKLGAYVKGENKIIISSARNKSEALSTILHEIQHWVQAQEGFAKGGSPDLFSDSSSYDDFYKNWKSMMDSLDDAYVLRRYMDRLGVSVAEAKSEYRKEFGKEHHPEAGGVAKAFTQEQIIEEINQHSKRLERGKKAARAGTSFEAYRRVAGEIEARDVQARSELTAEQRKATEPYSSENIALEDAILSPAGDAKKMIAKLTGAETKTTFTGGTYEKGGLLSTDGNLDKRAGDLWRKRNMQVGAQERMVNIAVNKLVNAVKAARKAGQEPPTDVMNTALGNLDNPLTQAQRTEIKRLREIDEDVARQADPSIAPLFEKMRKAGEPRRPQGENPRGRKQPQ
jgi:hypothetical protein